ncbi:D-glycero-beta-D-manno-heptose 1,7-bisphosphate 7-phosphatase [candidate division WWE3 bacterium]|jgi:D-glycero-D-manno-heptose 1,7-bisphosphate phosphatase|uniref:D,D-heptose 1,7-bisphosphate phosphatase n=1 Tax=candidate division WWE3 bacterium TaxID=2053526 RepID=A0A3A4ZGH3_UNCKA|nr:MAG: D-glycero-beta-D-manno-heptose 1,7-bisphosphate 7-phosphatase [candidate division WWE3 bacterium]
MSNKAVFLDRDGVINKKAGEHDYIKSPDQFVILPGVVEGLRILKEKGYLLIVVTNQAGIARGKMSLEDLERVHEKMEKELLNGGVILDKIYFCPHGYDDNCNCRKPAPGMIENAVKDFDIDLKESILIGDSSTDMETAHNAGVAGFLVESNSNFLKNLKTKIW